MQVDATAAVCMCVCVKHLKAYLGWLLNLTVFLSSFVVVSYFDSTKSLNYNHYFFPLFILTSSLLWSGLDPLFKTNKKKRPILC